MVGNRFNLDRLARINTIFLRIKEANDMRNGFTSGMLIGGIVGATMSMIMNHDIDMHKTRKRVMRMGKNVCRKSRHIISDIAGMMH